MEAVPIPVPITTAALIGPEKESVPPPIPERFVKEAVPQIAAPPRPPINWEQFMGAKLFAWIGGLALFLGVAFFVKYSFEHNLISPELRVAIGFVVGVSLVIGGLLLKRKENAVTAQTLCATGILVLYAVTFACRAYYHFAFFGLIPTFLLMTLITAVAFLLAVRLNAMVVAVLGIAGGFLTPVLLSTGQDYPSRPFRLYRVARCRSPRGCATATMECARDFRRTRNRVDAVRLDHHVLCPGKIFRRQQSPCCHGGVCGISRALSCSGSMGEGEPEK